MDNAKLAHQAATFLVVASYAVCTERTMSKGSTRRPEDRAAVERNWARAFGAPTRRYVTGTGQILIDVHAETPECAVLGCVIHSPTDPHRDWPTHFRADSGLMERICPHGIGHPDRDSVAWFERRGRTHMNVHGCDGCCAPSHVSK